MRLCYIVKEYREKMGISQRELAKLLHVSDMTISRLESGAKVRIDENLLRALSGIVNDKILDSTFGMSEVRQWFEYATILNTTDSLKISDYAKEQLAEKNVIGRILSQFETIGFRKVEENFAIRRSKRTGEETLFRRNDYTKFDVILENSIGKRWASDFFWSYPTPFDDTDDGRWLDTIYSQVGKCCCSSQIVQRYSIVTNVPDLQECAAYHAVDAVRLNRDMSIIYFDMRKERVTSEYDLAFFKDGRGIFDLAVEDKKKESAVAYAGWMLSLNER